MSITSIEHSKQYDSRKRAKELTKHRHDERGGNGNGKGGASDLADSNESEDAEVKLLTSKLDVQILRTLRAIKSGDKKVYDNEDGDKFLLEFMTHRRWLEGKVGSVRDDKTRLQGNNDDNDDSLQDSDRTDEFKSKYNF